MILLRCSLPLLLLLLCLLHLHWRASFMGVFRQPHSMHLVALAVGGLDHRDALLPHGLAVRHGGDGSHGALLFELLRLLVLLLLGRGWRCFNIWQFGAGLRGRRLCRRSRGERRRLWHRGCNWRRGHVGEVPSRSLVRRRGGPVFSVTLPKTILSSSLRMLSSLWKECTFPDGTADQCADQARTACHANLSACRRRTPERTRRDTSLESTDPSRSGRSPSACTCLFGEKGRICTLE